MVSAFPELSGVGFLPSVLMEPYICDATPTPPPKSSESTLQGVARKTNAGVSFSCNYSLMIFKEAHRQVHHRAPPAPSSARWPHATPDSRPESQTGSSPRDDDSDTGESSGLAFTDNSG